MKDKDLRKDFNGLIEHLGLHLYEGLHEVSCNDSKGITNRVGRLEQQEPNEEKTTSCEKCGAVYDKSYMTIGKVIEQEAYYAYPSCYASFRDVIKTKYYCPRCKKPKKSNK